MFSSMFRSPTFRRSTTLLTVAISANAWVANNAFAITARRAIAPATRTTLAEAAPSSRAYSYSSSYSSSTSTSTSTSSGGIAGRGDDKKKDNDAEAEGESSCGRAFYPKDVYYDSEVKKLLEELRVLKRDEIDDNDNADDNDNDNADDNTDTESKKSIGVLKGSGGKRSGTLTLIGYKGGPLESQINQDRAVVLSPFRVGNEGTNSERHEQREGNSTPPSSSSSSSQLIGCFDGHARLGEVVSEYVVKELPKLLASKLDTLKPDDDNDDDNDNDNNSNSEEEVVSKALTETFVEMDKTAPAEISGGCTASVVLQRGSKLYVANAGDSRSFVVVYRASKKTAEVVYISREDKPSLPDERERVEKAGGKVFLPPAGTSRVLYTDPESGLTSGLAMSRSIGDWEVGKLGVIPDPIIEVIDIEEVTRNHCESENDDDVCIFAVSATDGLMDYTTPEGIAAVVAVSMYEKDGPHLLTAMEQLIYLSAAGWERAKRGTYRDDIAIAVSEVRIPPSLQHS